MPKKQTELSPEEQRKRFEEAVREMVDAGELDPDEADEAFEKLVKGAIATK